MDPAPSIEAQVQETLSLLQQGEETMDFGPNTSRVLLIGNTGAGKSTLSQFIAGDINSLQSVDNGVDFIIEDGDKISDTTVVAHTIFPELVIDENTNTSYFDCPGFHDTRSASHEISATYFIKKVVDSAENIKIIIVVNHYSLRTGGDRQDFKTLVQHTAEFIKDVAKYRNGIAMIVTKVDSDRLTDDAVIDGVARFIGEFKRDMNKTDIDKKLHRNLMSLLNTLLMKNEGKYSRIGIFRRPNEEGPVGSITLLQTVKAAIVALIHDQVKYVSSDGKDFGFTISDRAINIIGQLRDAINENIAHIMPHIMKKIQYHYILLEQRCSYMKELIDELQKAIDILNIMAKKISETTDPNDFVEVITEAIRDLNVAEEIEEFELMKKRTNHLSFLQTVSGKQLNVVQKAFTKNVIKELTDTRNWYVFLTQMQSKLIHHGVPSRKNIPVLGEETPNPNGSHYTTSTFLAEIESYGINRFDIAKGIHVDRAKLKALNDILNAITNLELKVTLSQSEKLSAAGAVVRLSDVVAQELPQTLKIIEIFASDTVVFDDDIIRPGQELQVYILAPRWEVIGKRSINLDGLDGDAPAQPKAQNGVYGGSSGKDGDPGKPGGNGGGFFGIGKEFVRGQNLTITSRGGNGGKGQDGGDGSKGKDGVSAKLDTLGTNATVNEESGTMLISKIVTVTKEGWPGEKGGAGGNGGKSGCGGVGGEIVVHALGGNCKAVCVSNDGLEGKAGEKGIGGKGGRKGNGILRKFVKPVGLGKFSIGMVNALDIIDILHIDQKLILKTEVLEATERGESGIDGVDNVNIRGMQAVKSPTPLRKKDCVMNFKKFLKRNVQLCPEGNNISEFLSDLDSDPYILELIGSS